MSAMPDGTFADPQELIAELQRQLAECRTERDEALTQQTATAEMLQVINSSPGDLALVFEAMLDKALRLCDSVFGALWRYNGEYFELVAQRGVAKAVIGARSRHQSPTSPGTAIGQILAGENVVQLTNLGKDQLYKSGNPDRHNLVDCAGAQIALAVALRKDDKLLGHIVTWRLKNKLYSETQIALLQNFAVQAVIAIENARLMTETREAWEQQTATVEMLQVINSPPGDLVLVFEAMLEKVLRLCDASYGMLWTYDGEYFHVAAQRNFPRVLEVFLSQPIKPGPGTSVERIINGASIAHVADIREGAPYQEGYPRHRALVELAGARTEITIALRKDGHLLGVFVFYRHEVRPFSDKQIALLQNFAAQAVIAMENARLLGELRARTEEVAAWNRELEDRVQAQVAELERVGKLKQFLAPKLAELIVARGDENILETHRRDIVVVFCDLRGFTAFAETAEPEEVLELLREYHGALGPIVAASEGTLDHFSGDGIMMFFNDPVPVPDACERAVRMAIEMRAAMALLQAAWRRQGREIGFGVGMARGYAALGQIGFADRIDYTAIGTVCNLAARLCAEATDGQILISRRVAAAVEDMVQLEEIGGLVLKGLMQAVEVYNVASVRFR